MGFVITGRADASSVPPGESSPREGKGALRQTETLVPVVMTMVH
jgi:hypothetical protein